MSRSTEIWGFVCLAAAISVSLWVHKEIYKPLQASKTVQANYDKLYEEHDTLKSLFDKQKGGKLDPRVVEWAYKNAGNHVPKVDIIRMLNEASTYKTYFLMLAVFKEESRFDAYAKSSAGAKGLGQIRTKIPKSGKSVWLDEMIAQGFWEAEIDVYDYRKNIKATDYILNRYYKKYGGWSEALLRYVNGDSKYVTRVLTNYAELTLLAELSKAEVTRSENNIDISKGLPGLETSAVKQTSNSNDVPSK